MIEEPKKITKIDRALEKLCNPDVILDREITLFTNYKNNNNLVIEWTVKDIGYGEIEFEVSEDGETTITCDSMKKEFVLRILNFWVENSILE